MQEKEEEDAKSRHQLQHQVIQIKEETYNTTHSQKGEEDVARDKVDAPKPKRRLLDIDESDDDSDGESKMDELTRFWNFNICKLIS